MDVNALVTGPQETDPAVNTSLPIISYFERIPAELRFAIYSDFTFAECIRLSARMNRYLRLNILGWDGIVRTLSDEGGHCDLSQALRPFITQFPGSRVHNIMLSNDHLWPEFMSNFDVDLLHITLERTMNILTEWNCTSINKATFSLISFRLNDTWFDSFSRLGARSLTHLRITTGVTEGHILHMIKRLLHSFQNLICLSLESHNDNIPYHLMRSQTMARGVQRLVTLFAHQRARAPPPVFALAPGQSAALTDLCITLDIFGIRHLGLGTEDMFQAMPNLERFTVNIESVKYLVSLAHARGTLMTILNRVVIHCPRLEEIKIKVYPQHTREYQIDGFYDPQLVYTFIQENIATTRTGTRIFSVVGVEDEHAILYVRDIISNFRDTWKTIRLESQDVRKVQSFAIDFGLSSVRSVAIKFIGNASNQIILCRRQSPMVELDVFLETFPKLRHLELKDIRMNNAVLRGLLRFPRLRNLVLTRIKGLGISNFRGFRKLFRGNLVVNERSSR